MSLLSAYHRETLGNIFHVCHHVYCMRNILLRNRIVLLFPPCRCFCDNCNKCPTWCLYNRKKSVKLKRKSSWRGTLLAQSYDKYKMLCSQSMKWALHSTSARRATNQISPLQYICCAGKITTFPETKQTSRFWPDSMQFLTLSDSLFKKIFINQRKQSVNFSLHIQIIITWSPLHLAETVMDRSENSATGKSTTNEKILCKCVSLHIFHL